MKGTIALLFGAAVASPLAQRQSSDCQSTVSEAFQIAVVNQTSTAKRDLQRVSTPSSCCRIRTDYSFRDNSVVT